PVWTATAEQVSLGPDRFARVSDQDARIEPNRLFFAPLKDLEFGQGTINTTMKSTTDGAATVELTAHGYHYLTRILTPAPGVRFSANYLDLRDGETRQITVTGLPEDFDPANLLVTSYVSEQRVSAQETAPLSSDNYAAETRFRRCSFAGARHRGQQLLAESIAEGLRRYAMAVDVSLDHHQGVFLDNDQSEPFHVHTAVRSTNGGDYGLDPLRRHLARHHPQRHIGH
ncbi:MAG TPA: glycoside hydrolase family 2 protein, partial [Pseudonocardiaceae bacterium]